MSVSSRKLTGSRDGRGPCHVVSLSGGLNDQLRVIRPRAGGDGARDRQDSNALDPGGSQDPRALCHRGARRHHVVHEHHGGRAKVATGGPAAPTREGKGAAHVGVAASGRQSSLRRPVPATPQHAPDWKPESPGQIVRLIEAALPGAQRMQRHRDNGVRAGKNVGAGPHHERAERRSQEPPPAVLEHVNNLSKRSVVSTRAARQREDRGLPPAARAQRVGRAPRGERIAAPDATGRRQPRHRAPTRVAHRTRQWTVEHCRARGAEWLEKNANERVGCRDEHDAGRASGVQARGQGQSRKRREFSEALQKLRSSGVSGDCGKCVLGTYGTPEPGCTSIFSASPHSRSSP